MIKKVPTHLKSYILPFNWNVQLVWKLSANTETMLVKEFDYLLYVPLWSSMGGKGMLFDTKPIDVIRDENCCPYQASRIKRADLDYPIDIIKFQSRLWILDGIHRLAKLYLLQKEKVLIRCHDESVMRFITVG